MQDNSEGNAVSDNRFSSRSAEALAPPASWAYVTLITFNPVGLKSGLLPDPLFLLCPLPSGLAS